MALLILMLQGNMCTCQPGYTTNLIGPAACGPSINPTGNASDAAALAGQLCTLYGNAFDRMMQVRPQLPGWGRWVVLEASRLLIVELAWCHQMTVDSTARRRQ